MSGDKYQKKLAGQPLEIPAATWNAMVDAARQSSEAQHDQATAGKEFFRQGDIIKVRNSSGQDLPRLSILIVDRPLIEPAEQLREFKNQVAIEARIPQLDHRGRFIVLLEPLRSGKIGRAWASGLCPARVDVKETWHGWADIVPGSTSALESRPSGSAQILWREAGLGKSGRCYEYRIVNECFIWRKFRSRVFQQGTVCKLVPPPATCLRLTIKD